MQDREDRPARRQPDAPAPPAAAAAPAAPCHASAHTRRWHSAELFGRNPEIEIQHGQAVYRLRRTALGKLILTK